MMPCMLDYFPWEILHTIFDFLNTIDLLRAFTELNPNVDGILHSYTRIQLNFKSMKKSKFYFLCENISPNQIQSLVLSDDKQTPGQIKLFMSLLPLIKFINLRSITILQIHDANLLCLMLSHLENHPRIQSLSVDSHQIQINKKLCRSIGEILTTLPSLEHLTYIDSSPLSTLKQPLSKLTNLTIRFCKYSDLQIIFHWIPNLVYLEISVPYDQHMLTFDYIPPNLSSLIIESKSWMLFNELENLFSLTSSLKCFLLETMGEPELLDGRRWQTLIKTKLPHLTEFALNISPGENNMTGDDVLIPFQDSFWIIEKHWHMACLIQSVTQTCARLFSVPRFSSIDDWYPSSEGFFNYSLSPYSFNDDCTDLRVSHFPSQVLISSPFKHIQTLSLEYTTDNIDSLKQIVNLLSVNHLKFGSPVECLPFAELLQSAPNIDQLSMARKTLIQIIDSLPDDQNAYEQIKQLNVKDVVLNTDIDQICRIFPKLEYVSLSVKHRDDIPFIFNRLKHLTSANVSWMNPFKTSQSILDEYLQQSSICTDGTYWLSVSSIDVWID